MIRRDFLLTGLAASFAFRLSSAIAQTIDKSRVNVANCLVKISEISSESVDAAGFDHYHVLAVPIVSLLQPPKDGITLTTNIMDQGSYDIEGLTAFSESSKISEGFLKQHTHQVRISRDQLEQISQGMKDVKIEVYTRDGKALVHNFYLTAPPSVLARIRRHPPVKS